MRFFGALLNKFVQVLGDLSLLISGTFRLILGNGSDSEEGSSKKSSWFRAIRILFRVLLFPIYALFWIVTSPIRVFTVFSAERRRDFLLGVPAILCFALLVTVATTVFARSGNIAGTYRSRGYAAIADGKFDRAKTFFGRVISDSRTPAPNDLFQWSLILSQTGDADRAAAILDQLAPNDKIGLAEAHRRKALVLISGLPQAPDANTLRNIRWHLENSGDNRTAEINQGWSLYYLAVQQPENALKYMQLAANVNPELLLSAAQITESLGDINGRDRILRQAKERFGKMLTKDPLDHRTRILMATAQVRLEELAEAEKLLRTGSELQPDEMIQKATADFFVMRHDLAVKERLPFAKQLGFLDAALGFDPNHLPVYQRLISQSRVRQNTDDADEITTLLEETIARGQSTALAHFALSNILWMDDKKEESQFHMEQAYRLESRFTVIANNLAWLLAHSEEPDLDRALDLARGVVAQTPDDARFRDTLATVLLKQEKYDEALLEFEKTLQTIQNKKPIHEKLAVIYDHLKKPNMAKLHREQAEKL